MKRILVIGETVSRQPRQAPALYSNFATGRRAIPPRCWWMAARRTRATSGTVSSRHRPRGPSPSVWPGRTWQRPRTRPRRGSLVENRVLVAAPGSVAAAALPWIGSARVRSRRGNCTDAARRGNDPPLCSPWPRQTTRISMDSCAAPSAESQRIASPRGAGPWAVHGNGRNPLFDGNSGRSRDVMLVGARGFEPPTPRSRTECSTRLSHAPTGRNRSLPRRPRERASDFRRLTPTPPAARGNPPALRAAATSSSSRGTSGRAAAASRRSSRRAPPGNPTTRRTPSRPAPP